MTPKSEDGDGSFLDEPQEQPSQSLSDAEAFTAYLAQIQAEARQKLKAAKYEAVKVAAESDRESSALSRGAIQWTKFCFRFGAENHLSLSLQFSRQR